MERMGKRRRILNHVPAEIMEEILYKLPVKSLLRFKCVSKSWRSLISSKGFVREHLNKSNSGTDFTHHNITFTYHQPTSQIEKCIGSLSIGSLLNGDDYGPNRSNLSIPNPIPIPALEDTDVIHFLGSCNGLILITINHRELYLWNPSTRKAKDIRNPQETASWRGCHRSGYGLGYDESTDDYKVVCIFSDLYRLHQKQTYMYSSRTDSWKIIQNLDKGSLSLSHPAKFVNGRLHWLTDKDKDRPRTSSRYIVSLDLVEEKYQIVPLPHCLWDDCYYPYTSVLKDLGGYLSFVGNNIITNSRDVWVMKKDESWSKIWTSTCHLPLAMPLLLKKNGDILVGFGLDLAIYHGKDKLRQSRVDMLEAGFDPIVYVESLVSPFGDDEQLHRH